MAEQKSLMDDLAEAWDQSESENVDTEEMEPEVEAVEGEPADEPDGGPESEADEPADADGVPGGEETPDVEAPTPDSDLEKAPPGLQPAAREAWKDTPEAVRKEIQKREKYTSLYIFFISLTSLHPFSLFLSPSFLTSLLVMLPHFSFLPILLFLPPFYFHPPRFSSSVPSFLHCLPSLPPASLLPFLPSLPIHQSVSQSVSQRRFLLRI